MKWKRFTEEQIISVLKHIVADQILDMSAIKDLLPKPW